MDVNSSSIVHIKLQCRTERRGKLAMLLQICNASWCFFLVSPHSLQSPIPPIPSNESNRFDKPYGVQSKAKCIKSMISLHTPRKKPMTKPSRYLSTTSIDMSALHLQMIFFSSEYVRVCVYVWVIKMRAQIHFHSYSIFCHSDFVLCKQFLLMNNDLIFYLYKIGYGKCTGAHRSDGQCAQLLR